jgi:hypothetical protein
METGFEERKKKHEEKWALDEQLRFKAEARRNKLFGRWAALEMGLTAEEAEIYAKTVVTTGMQGGDAGVLAKTGGDLAAKGAARSAEALRTKLGELAAVAAKQVQAGI